MGQCNLGENPDEKHIINSLLSLEKDSHPVQHLRLSVLTGVSILLGKGTKREVSLWLLLWQLWTRHSGVGFSTACSVAPVRFWWAASSASASLVEQCTKLSTGHNCGGCSLKTKGLT